MQKYGCICPEQREMPEFHVENLPMEFLENLAKLHVSDDGKCPLCYNVTNMMETECFLKLKPIQWMVEKNMPKCIWALGKYIMDRFQIEPMAMDRHNRITDKCYKGGNAKLEEILYQRRCGQVLCTKYKVLPNEITILTKLNKNVNRFGLLPKLTLSHVRPLTKSNFGRLTKL